MSAVMDEAIDACAMPTNYSGEHIPSKYANVQALLALKKLLQGKHEKYALPEHYIFDMRHWMIKGKTNLMNEYNHDEKKVNGCKTSGCALGYAIMLLPEFKKHYKLVNGGGTRYFLHAKNEEGNFVVNSWVSQSIGNHLGLTYNEFWYLFAEDDGYAEVVSPEFDSRVGSDFERPRYGASGRKDVIRRINCLLKQLKAEGRIPENVKP